MRLAALSTYIPPERIAAEAIVRAAGGSLAEARVFERMFGLQAVARFPQGRALSDLFAPMIPELEAAHDGAPPDTLITVSGLPGSGAETRLNPGDLTARFGFLRQISHLYRIDQNNCGGVFWALDMARNLLTAGGARSVLVLAGDTHAPLALADRYLPGCTLMGDALCGFVLDRKPGGLQVGPIALHSHPEFCFGHAGNSAQMGRFFRAHGDLVRSALDAVGFDWFGQGALLPHNVNRFAWQSFARETGLPASRIRLGLLPDVGHCYTTDPFLLLAQELSATPRPPAPLTLVSAGIGGFVGACRLTPEASLSLLSSFQIKETVS
ncbi:MAG: hypothetical protein AB7U46_09500 [Paenirhodobacter sp.]|uniref:hypothetical protein n=1 Tax=Paenirhodobacter sp. TaxID=1965326 RepID=UPI003D0B6A77